MGVPSEPGDQLLTPAEVAALFRVAPKTVTRWAQSGKLASIRTLGGHRRYRASDVQALLGAASQERLDGAGNAPERDHDGQAGLTGNGEVVEGTPSG